MAYDFFDPSQFKIIWYYDSINFTNFQWPYFKSLNWAFYFSQFTFAGLRSTRYFFLLSLCLSSSPSLSFSKIKMIPQVIQLFPRLSHSWSYLSHKTPKPKQWHIPCKVFTSYSTNIKSGKYVFAHKGTLAKIK